MEGIIKHVKRHILHIRVSIDLNILFVIQVNSYNVLRSDDVEVRFTVKGRITRSLPSPRPSTLNLFTSNKSEITSIRPAALPQSLPNSLPQHRLAA